MILKTTKQRPKRNFLFRTFWIYRNKKQKNIFIICFTEIMKQYKAEFGFQFIVQFSLHLSF